MADLNSALSSLGPVDFSSVPTSTDEQKKYLDDLFSQAELILESIPIPDPSSQDESQPHAALKASEVTPSSARSPSPSPEHAALQKDWGKPMKLSAKDNPLSMSVFKKSAKDGRGAWFARRSVHEGIGFARFRHGLELEFEESLANDGPPGSGNVRGIGGEKRVENINVANMGNISVCRLSAQFPGPTTPRDFVTCLITSDNAMSTSNANTPRHYMIISKPCNHPDTQPTSNFIRGTYESVEFIREVPRKPKASASASTGDLPDTKRDSDAIGKNAVIRNAEQRSSAHARDGDNNPTGKENEPLQKRSSTAPGHPGADSEGNGAEGSEDNPVEWIMVTRSDPGGNVPRFMVERGTPSSICADAVKFLDWATAKDFDQSSERTKIADEDDLQPIERRKSAASWRSSRIAGVSEPTTLQEQRDTTNESRQPEQPPTGGIVQAVETAVAAYTPQAILDRLPGSGAASPKHDDTNAAGANIDTVTRQQTRTPKKGEAGGDDDADSFASADSHLGMTSDLEDMSDSPSNQRPSSEAKRALNQHEKELLKIEERRKALQNKFSASRAKLEKEQSELNDKEEAAHKKALEKHEREMRKHEEKYEKELKKLEDRQKREREKLEERHLKMADKDEKQRLTRERDEARQELELSKKEADVLRRAVEELQRENTELVAKLGTIVGVSGEAVDREALLGGSGKSNSRSSSVKKVIDRAAEKETRSATPSNLSASSLKS